MTWIATRERLPTKEDAGDFDHVLVLMLPYGLRHYETYLRLPRYVNPDFHTHWARLPDRPEEEHG